MSTEFSLPDDPLFEVLDSTTQQQAANIAQEAFSRVFRLSAEMDDDAAADSLRAQLGTVEQAVRNWLGDAADEQAYAVRLALLLQGLDQWGMAWSGAFGLQAIPALSALLGGLRTGLNAEQDAHMQRAFDLLNHDEAAGVDFNITLRRGLHLALWHAMIACESLEAAQPILKQLGSLWVGLIERRPQLGWRLVADALAHIQIACLSEGLAQEGASQTSTQALFAALRQAVGEDRYKQMMAHATQVLLAWQQQKRQTAH